MGHNQKFCVGLADPSVHELTFSGAKRWPGVVRAVVKVARAVKKCPPLTARNILCSSKLSERKEGLSAVAKRIRRCFCGRPRM